MFTRREQFSQKHDRSTIRREGMSMRGGGDAPAQQSCIPRFGMTAAEGQLRPEEKTMTVQPISMTFLIDRKDTPIVSAILLPIISVSPASVALLTRFGGHPEALDMHAALPA